MEVEVMDRFGEGCEVEGIGDLIAKTLASTH